MKTNFSRYLNRARLALLAAALAFAGANLVSSHLLHAKDTEENPKLVPARLNVDDSPISRDGRLATTYSPMVKKVAPSVVKVFTSTKPRIISPRMLPPDEFFRRFFGWDDAPNGGGGGGGGGGRSFRGAPRQHGLGSGVIVTKDGYILTNHHVIENADENDIQVVLNDGRKLKAKLVGKDPRTDIAVLKAEGESFPALTFADSDKLEIGDVVFAVGNPFGIGQTVTMGIVSAKGRTLMPEGTGKQEDFIQTDAAINPGNSGGALVDSQGRLVGINTAILSGTGGNLGIGFAVPSNIARFVMESITKSGRVVRGYMGVFPQDLDSGLAKEFKLKDTRGVLLAEVTPGSPAAEAGLKEGDVIVELEGSPVENSHSFRLQVAQTAPGTKAAVKTIRDGSPKTFTVKLGESPADKDSSRVDRLDKRQEDLLDGVTVDDLDRNTREQLNLPRGVNGAIVVRIDPDSPSYEKGLREGDVIQEINRKPVTSADDAVRLSDKVKGDTALLKIWRDGVSRYIVVEEKR